MIEQARAEAGTSAGAGGGYGAEMAWGDPGAVGGELGVLGFDRCGEHGGVADGEVRARSARLGHSVGRALRSNRRTYQGSGSHNCTGEGVGNQQPQDDSGTKNSQSCATLPMATSRLLHPSASPDHRWNEGSCCGYTRREDRPTPL